MENNTDSILRISQVCKITGLSSTTIWRYSKAGLMPAKRRIGLQAAGFLTSEISAWISSRPAINKQ